MAAIGGTGPVCSYFHCPHTMETGICPVPKVPQPRSHNEFRPISITPVLTRIIRANHCEAFVASAKVRFINALNNNNNNNNSSILYSRLNYPHSPLQISLPSVHPAPLRLH